MGEEEIQLIREEISDGNMNAFTIPEDNLGIVGERMVPRGADKRRILGKKNISDSAYFSEEISDLIDK